MNWKQSLDRYLTQEPPDNSAWYEQCSELIECSQTVYDMHEKLIDKWMEHLSDREHSPIFAASLITKLLSNPKYQ